MDYHANRNDLLIEPASFNELISDKDIFKGYCLFLDEFVGDIEQVLIRNFARLVEIRCIVANTNSIIANLTGKIQSGMSRDSDKINVWSIVITRLNPVSRGVMKNVFKIEELAENLSKICAAPDHSKLKKFTDALTGEEGKIALVRPGLIGTVIEAIKGIIEQSRLITIRQLIEKIVEKLGEKISSVKKVIRTTINVIMANLCLLSLHAYEFEFDSKNESNALYHRKSFLADHLFCLINPVLPGSFLFLTYPPETLNSSLGIYVGGNEKLVRVDWEHEFTCFRYEDILTILACMSIASKKSILTNLNEAIAKGDEAALTVSDISNPDAKSLNGNHLEVLTAFTVIDATHSFLNIGNLNEFSLSGRNGIVFIKNVLLNCIESNNYRRNANITLKFSSRYVTDHDFNVEAFLENLNIPFLCPFNSEIPDFLDNLKSDDPWDDGIHVGKYRRAANSENIDAVFDFYVKERSAKVPKLEKPSSPAFKALVECKNWNVPVNSTEVYNILLESGGQKNSFIFCNSITSPNEEYKPLRDLCDKKKVLLYRFVKNPQGLSFTVIPYHSVGFKFYTEKPEMVCFVFELDEINKKI